MHASQVTPAVTERANELYWESDKSVNQIADDLELSKGTLYGIIEPRPSGLGCPLCGDQVVYSNRTAEEREMLDCPTCDWDGTPDETVTYPGPGHRSAGQASGIASPADTDAEEDVAGPSGTDPHREGAGALIPRRIFGAPVNTVAGGALLGAAAGLALVMWARRR